MGKQFIITLDEWNRDNVNALSADLSNTQSEPLSNNQKEISYWFEIKG